MLFSSSFARRLLITFLVTAIFGWYCQELLWLELQTPKPAETETSIQPYLDRVVDQLTEFLDNGMKFIVLEQRKHQ